jgi:hypothetical protein
MGYIEQLLSYESSKLISPESGLSECGNRKQGTQMNGCGRAKVSDD